MNQSDIAIKVENLTKVNHLYDKPQDRLNENSNTKSIVIRPNKSTYIPIGEIHRLENPGKIDVVLIEAQVGGYLGENDIVRIEDDFRRD